MAEVVDTRKGASLDFDSNEFPVAAFEDKVDFPPIPVAVVEDGKAVQGLGRGGEFVIYPGLYEFP